MKSTTVSTSIGASGFSAALVVMVVWALKSAGVDMPADVAAAMGTILTGLTHYIVSLNSSKCAQSNSPTLPNVPNAQLVAASTAPDATFTIQSGDAP